MDDDSGDNEEDEGEEDWLRQGWRSETVSLFFIFVVIGLCSLFPIRLRRYERKSVEVGVFRRGGSLWAQISEGRGIAHQPLLVSEN